MTCSLFPRSTQDRCRSSACYIVLILSISLSLIQVQASPSAFPPDIKELSQDDLRERRLEQGSSIERKLAGGQVHSYLITMITGQYLRLIVDQRGIDVVVELVAPGGEKISEVDSPTGTAGAESVTTIAEATGLYRVEVRSLEKDAQPGGYEVKVEALRASTAEDRYRVAAGSVFQKAKELENGTAEAKRESIEKYHEALELYRRAGERRNEAETLTNIGVIHYLLGDMGKALERFNEALSVGQAIGDRYREAEVLNNLGVVYEALGERQKALEKYNEALPIIRAIGDRSGEAAALHNMGMAYNLLGEKQKALEKYGEALPIRREVGDSRGEAATLNNIGLVQYSLGEMQKALDKYNEALPIRRGFGDRRGEAVTLHNIGSVYDSLGEMQKALDKYNEALPIRRDVGDRSGEAITLHNIGSVYQSLGEMGKALEKYNEALVIFGAVGHRQGEAEALNSIGSVYDSSGERQKAIEKFNDALLISRTIDDRSMEAAALANLGKAHNLLGEIQKALENYNAALPISRGIGDRGKEAVILLGIARLEQKRGNLGLARQTIEQAIDIIESLRANISSQELRASYFASRQEFYESYIDVLMQLRQQNREGGFDAEALAASERARARSLLELLAEARADIRQGADGLLLERERSLQQLLNSKASAYTNLLNRRHTSAQADAAAKEIASITAEYEEVEARIRASSPRYAALIRPQPLNLAQIQQQVLDPETLLLEYSLGDNASYLFVVSHTSITSHRLPKRAEIEAATRQVRELLTAPYPRSGEALAEYEARVKEANGNYWPQAAALSRMLLGPAAAQLGAKRLLIVTDGALQYLPFGVLPVPVRRATATRRLSGVPIPLIAKHEIVHLPSASTLGVLRRELAGRQPAEKAVAVLADPVFNVDDARVRLADRDEIARAGKESSPDLARAANHVGSDLRRLYLTRDEAKAILSVTSQDDGLAALDFRASRATATSDELSRYRIVHFATHGLLDSRHPKLSGLVLSLVDEQGRPQDGFLRLHEIFNLRLPAELVVLSACQTGLGKEIKGEGLVGLTRGFMYAGAARVMASLWQVDDAATAELMKLFYRRMLQDGMRPAAALRAAQIQMWKRSQRLSPFFWGAFVLQGEWR